MPVVTLTASTVTTPSLSQTDRRDTLGTSATEAGVRRSLSSSAVLIMGFLELGHSRNRESFVAFCWTQGTKAVDDASVALPQHANTHVPSVGAEGPRSRVHHPGNSSAEPTCILLPED